MAEVLYEVLHTFGISYTCISVLENIINDLSHTAHFPN